MVFLFYFFRMFIIQLFELVFFQDCKKLTAFLFSCFIKIISLFLRKVPKHYHHFHKSSHLPFYFRTVLFWSVSYNIQQSLFKHFKFYFDCIFVRLVCTCRSSPYDTAAISSSLEKLSEKNCLFCVGQISA